MTDKPFHAVSRYTAVTEGVIAKCQKDYRAGRDMSRSIPSLTATEATLVATQSLAADALFQKITSGNMDLPLEILDDWSLAVLAEILFSIAHDGPGLLDDQRQLMVERAWMALEHALDSPTISPMLWYEEVFTDVAQEYRIKRDQRAIELLVRGLAHNLQYHEGDNADIFLRDLAEAHLALGELDRGLGILTSLLRNDPSDIWIYNLAAITFTRFGLASLGIEAARRGLEILEATGDPERLHDQFLRAMDELQGNDSPGRERDVTPSVLADFRAALALDLEAGARRPVVELCRELIPGLDQTPVKGPPQAPEPLSASGKKPTQSVKKKPTGARSGTRKDGRRKKKGKKKR